jgi:metallo-beta-lactamase family protein
MRPLARGLKRVFLVHGEPTQQDALAKLIQKEYGIEAGAPARGESFTLA